MTPAGGQVGGTWQQSSLWGHGEGRLLVTGGIDIGLAHRLPGKPAEDKQNHHCPFDKLSWWRCSELKIRTITSWGWEQVCRHLLIRLRDKEGRSVRLSRV